MVKHVVRRILPQIPGTFKRGKWGYLRGFRAGSDIFGAVAEVVSQLPNQAPYQLGHTRILSYEKLLVVVKYVVKEILAHF